MKQEARDKAEMAIETQDSDHAYEVAVIVCTFNSSLAKTLMTLQSAITQDIGRLQLVIVDDGSCTSNQKAVCDFLDREGFSDYLYFENERNMGTVESLLRVLPYVSAPFVKPISPGDFFYNKDSLRRLLKSIKETDAAFAFGRILYYEASSKGIRIHNVHRPIVIGPYRKNANSKKNRIIKRNMIRYWDGIWGAAIIYNRSLFESYLSRLAGRIRLCEDLCTRLMLLDRLTVSFLDEWTIWYEYGTGVSTSSTPQSVRRINADVMAFQELLISDYPEDSDVITMRDNELLKKRFPAFVDVMVRALRDPRRAVFFIRKQIDKLIYRANDYDISLLSQVLSQFGNRTIADFEDN